MRSLFTFAVLSFLFLSCDVPEQTGHSCTVKDEGDGTKTISCPDGSSVRLSDGASGAQGAAGATGASCSVSPAPDAGAKVITCTDGTSVTVTNGATGPAGAAGVRGTPGVAWLLRLEEEPPGSHCVAGGSMILSGPDTNANGVLDLPAEVRTTAWVCNGEPSLPCRTLEGGLTIRNSLDWANLVRAGCSSITGELAIEAPGLTTLDPAAALVSVGSLRVQNNDTLEGLSLPSLEEITGSMAVTDNANLKELGLPKLTRVGGTLTVSNNAALRQCLVDEVVQQLTSSPSSYTAAQNDGVPNTCP